MKDIQSGKVLACIDGSRYSSSVCDYAAWISTRVGTSLKLLHSIEHRETLDTADLSGAIGLGSQERLLSELSDLEQQRSKLMKEKGKLMLAAAEERVREAGVTEVEARQRHGSLTDSLIELESAIRVLVLGIRGEATEDNAEQVGNQVQTIIRALHKPILVVNQAYEAPKRIMLAYNKSAAAEKALEMVATSPLYKGLPCHLVHVSSDGKGGDKLLDHARTILTNAGLEVTVAKLPGKVEDALCAYQAENDIDLTVMGAFGHTRIHDLLIGSFTARMLAKTKKPMLLLR